MDSSQLETLLSFDYVLTIILNNVWTCMAILTAGAISFIWSTSIKSSSPSSSPRFEQALSVSSHQKPKVVHSCSPQLCEPVPKNAISTPVLDCMDAVIKRGKFAVYFYDDEVQEEDYYRGNVVCAETEYDDVTDGGVTLICCRELNMGWYRYLDLTVFNGNVVRFWD
ncbi:hypothetical protein POM88_048234 [Heracleum sosnowskyi]|uniref:Transmembrane protein n=1 Tax=Heracleum sosnowskyi TaxID=360622 RepID=A0AAD8M0E7_9APIA|nr:hypothetical protein POM88_048234 [Heracleum sosnowskyi]